MSQQGRRGRALPDLFDIDEVIKKRGRTLQAVELFSQRCYESKIKPEVDAEVAALGLGSKQRLAVIKRKTREVFEREPQESKQEIWDEIDRLKLVKHDDISEDAEITPA